jgi:hypothetical protein
MRIMRMIYLSILATSDDIEYSITISESIDRLTYESEMIFLEELLHITIFISTRHLIEDDRSPWCKKWQRPPENIIDIGCCTRDDDIIHSCMTRVLGEILSTSMDCRYILQS